MNGRMWSKVRSGVARFGAAVLAAGSVALANPADTFKTAACNIQAALSNPAIVFGAMLLIVLWAGYSIYMGKRDATEVMVRGLLASAIVLGARTIAGWIQSGTC